MKNAHIPTKLRKLDSHSQQHRPIAASPITVVCWNTFPTPQFGFNGWISMLKSILGSLCREYHYVLLPWKPSRLQTLGCCGWLGCSTQLLPLLKVLFVYCPVVSSLSDSWGMELLLLRGRGREDKQDAVAASAAAQSQVLSDRLCVLSPRSSTWAASIPPPNQALLPNARWKSRLLSSLCSPRTAGHKNSPRRTAERSDNLTSTEDFMIHWGS